jgi:hypothetical protein
MATGSLMSEHLGGPASYFSGDYIGGVTLNKAGTASISWFS